MPWSQLFLVFVACHLAGDFLLQTDRQATGKFGALGGGGEPRALLGHVAVYTVAFVPALIALGAGAAESVGIAALIAGPHLVQDDGRLLKRYIVAVKHSDAGPGELLFVLVDQSFHLLALFAVALLAGS